MLKKRIISNGLLIFLWGGRGRENEQNPITTTTPIIPITPIKSSMSEEILR